jgi:hypothetical protein
MSTQQIAPAQPQPQPPVVVVVPKAPFIAPPVAIIQRNELYIQYISLIVALCALVFTILGIICTIYSQRIQNPTPTPICLSSSEVTSLTNVGIASGILVVPVFLSLFAINYFHGQNTGRYYSVTIVLLFIGALAVLATSIMIAVVAKRITPSSTTQCMASSDLRTLQAAAAINIVVGVLFALIVAYMIFSSEGILCRK